MPNRWSRRRTGSSRRTRVTPSVDYAYYMRGVAWFPKTPFVANDWFDVDQAETDGSGAERSFQYFRRLVDDLPQQRVLGRRAGAHGLAAELPRPP